jgi:hypothetical protein
MPVFPLQRTGTCSMSVSDMVFGLIKRMNANIQRRVRRAFLSNPEKLPDRIAMAMASVLLLSIVITYNVLFEKQRREGDCLFFLFEAIQSISFDLCRSTNQNGIRRLSGAT